MARPCSAEAWLLPQHPGKRSRNEFLAPEKETTPETQAPRSSLAAPPLVPGSMHRGCGGFWVPAGLPIPEKPEKGTGVQHPIHLGGGENAAAPGRMRLRLLLPARPEGGGCAPWNPASLPFSLSPYGSLSPQPSQAISGRKPGAEGYGAGAPDLQTQPMKATFWDWKLRLKEFVYTTSKELRLVGTGHARLPRPLSP